MEQNKYLPEIKVQARMPLQWRGNVEMKKQEGESENDYIERMTRLSQRRNQAIKNVNQALHLAAKLIFDVAKQPAYFVPVVGNAVLAGDVAGQVLNKDYTGAATTLGTVGALKYGTPYLIKGALKVTQSAKNAFDKGIHVKVNNPKKGFVRTGDTNVKYSTGESSGDVIGDFRDAKNRVFETLNSPEMLARWKSAYPGKSNDWYEHQLLKRRDAYRDAFANTHVKNLGKNHWGESVIRNNYRLPSTDELTYAERLRMADGKNVLRKYIDLDNSYININPNSPEFGPTVVHEAMHFSTGNLDGNFLDKGKTLVHLPINGTEAVTLQRPLTMASVVDHNNLYKPKFKDNQITNLYLHREDPYYLSDYLKRLEQSGMSSYQANDAMEDAIRSVDYISDNSETQSRLAASLLYDFKDVPINDEKAILDRLSNIEEGYYKPSANLRDLLNIYSKSSIAKALSKMLLGTTAATVIKNNRNENK